MDTELPADLQRLGFKLIIRAPDRMFAVSSAWGCTETSPDVQAVTRQARSLVAYFKRRAAAEARENAADRVAKFADDTQQGSAVLSALWDVGR